MAQEIIVAHAPLPGIVPEEAQSDPPWLTKRIKCDEEHGQVAELGMQSVERFGINGKLSFFRWLTGWRKKNTAVEEVTNENNLVVTSDTNQRPVALKVFPTKQPFIPYAVAVSYIAKISEDMQQMQCKHNAAIEQLECTRKEEKKDHERKIKMLKRTFKAYHDQVVKKDKQWQDTVKDLMKRNDELMEENRNILHQASQENEKWKREKNWLLKTFNKKVDILPTHHPLTTQELKEISVDLEKGRENLKFAQSHPNASRSPGKTAPWNLGGEVVQGYKANL